MILQHISTVWIPADGGAPPSQQIRMVWLEDDGAITVEYAFGTDAILCAIDHAGIYLPSGRDCD